MIGHAHWLLLRGTWKCLQWARANGCPWDEGCCWAAAVPRSRRRASKVAVVPSSSTEHADIRTLTVTTRVKPEFDDILDACIPSHIKPPGQGLCGETTQEEAFQVVAMPLLTACVTGHNATIFAYGETGSGKTHTIFGPPNALTDAVGSDHESWGLFPRAASWLLNQADTTLTLSAVEVYMNRVHDLFNDRTKLNVGGSAKASDNSMIDRVQASYDENGKWQCPKYGGSGIREQYSASGATSRPLNDVSDIIAAARTVEASRTAASHQLNARSSRSHAVLTLNISRRFDGGTKMRTSKFVFVDLAGSERLMKSGVTGLQANQARNVNLSLSALGRVVSQIGQGARHVPFRDSVLTQYLQPALSGVVVTGVVLTVRASDSSQSETASTLSFGKNLVSITRRHSIAAPTTQIVDVRTQQAAVAIRLEARKRTLQSLRAEGEGGRFDESANEGLKASFRQYKQALADATHALHAAKEAEAEAKAADDQDALAAVHREMEAADHVIFVNEGLVQRMIHAGVWTNPSARFIRVQQQIHDLENELAMLL